MWRFEGERGELMAGRPARHRMLVAGCRRMQYQEPQQDHCRTLPGQEAVEAERYAEAFCGRKVMVAA